MNVDLYIRRDGWLHRLDPRTRFVFTLVFIALALILNRPVPMLATLIVLHVTPVSSQIPVRSLAQAWRALWPITLMIVALSSLTLGADAADLLVRIGPFGVTATSLSTAITMALRVDCLAFAFLVTLWTTPQGELVAGLTRLGLPHGASLTLAIAMQFVPTFGRIFGEIMEAQQSRGLIIPRLNPLKAARAYLPVLVPLLITALRTADNLSMALSARGYGAGENRTSRRQLHMAGGDRLTLAALALLLALSLLWRLT